MALQYNYLYAQQGLNTNESIIFTQWSKKEAIVILTINLSNVFQFSEFFHRQTWQ